MTSTLLSQLSEVEAGLDALLSSMSYPNNEVIRKGLRDIIEMISDYHEEGTPLFPDVIVADSVDFFKTFNNNRLKVAKNEMDRGEFSLAIKMCAPLAVDGWGIYFIISGQDNSIEYGVLTTELQVLSLDLYEQTMGAEIPELNCLFIRNVGNKVVEVRDVRHQFLVALNLSDEYTPMDETIKQLVDIIMSDKDDRERETKNYLAKAMQQTMNEGHGNLIAVIQEDEVVIQSTLDNLHGGICLDSPIDLSYLISDYRNIHSEEQSLRLRSYTNLMKSMLNFDGITLFSDHGKVLGYHFIVNNNLVTDEHVQGGARTRAYLALCNLDCIKACFMKSQDGKVKFHSK